MQKYLAAQRNSGQTQKSAVANDERWMKPELADSQRVPPSELDASRPPQELNGVDDHAMGQEKYAPMSRVEMG